MKQQLMALFELQKLDLEITRLNAALTALDGALELRKKHAAAKKHSDKTHQTLTDTELQLKNYELELKTIDAKRASSEKKLYSGAIMSAKEVSSLEHEIDHLKNQQDELDGKTLELYDTVETLREQSKAAAAGVQELEQQVKDGIAKEAVERKRLEAEIEAMTPKREELASKVTDRQLLSRYESIRKRTSNTGMARIIDHKCNGCKIGVSSFIVRNAYDGKTIDYCENCGRILIMVDE